jgi:hypothetical protein
MQFGDLAGPKQPSGPQPARPERRTAIVGFLITFFEW